MSRYRKEEEARIDASFCQTDLERQALKHARCISRRAYATVAREALLD
jgi:hypothetical protein